MSITFISATVIVLQLTALSLGKSAKFSFISSIQSKVYQHQKFRFHNKSWSRLSLLQEENDGLPSSSSRNTTVKKASLIDKVKRDRYDSTKVVTDIDDTVWSSGGLKLFGLIPLGGIDVQYKRKQFYPGVVQFALELSTNPSTNPRIKERGVTPNEVSVLTARAKELKFALALKPKSKINKKYRSVGVSNGYKDWGIGDVYYGSVREWVLQNLKGVRKFQNFEIMLDNDYSSCGERMRYIFIGDTGEKDEHASELIIDRYHSKVSAVFLHVVNGRQEREKLAPMPQDRKVKDVPIYYFRTYVGAGYKAYKSNLISKSALKRITAAAIKDLEAYYNRESISDINENNVIHDSRWKELKQDIEQVAFLRDLT